MDGFKKPTRPEPNNSEDPLNHLPRASEPEIYSANNRDELSSIDMSLGDSPSSQSAKPRTKWLAILGGLLVLIIALIGLTYGWYNANLQPVDAGDDSVQRVEIKEGSSLNFVADRLEERGVIRSGLAFRILASLSGKQTDMKAGTCDLSPSDPARAILDKITTGCHDFKVVTFYPGATLETSLYAKTKAEEQDRDFKDMSIRASLRSAGYSDNDISEAFRANYNSPLFAGKPSGQGYEGYIFGETYYVDTDASAREVLQVAFDEMYSVVSSDNLAAKYEAQGLSLYEGITLASIVERELSCEGKPTEERQARCYEYQRRIAEVFYNRLNLGMSLGSDVTSIYASDKLNVPSTVDVDSPYNTRKYAGLTPGPIATPGKLALLSVANPTEGNDLYFLAGDDGLIYFAKNEAGHQANITNHCQKLCGDL